MLELLWPFPLIVVGISGTLNPYIIGLALGIALLPAPIRWASSGRFSQPSIIGCPLLLFVISSFVGLWASYQPMLSFPILLTLLGSVTLFFAIINTPSPRDGVVGLVVMAGLVATYFVTQYAHFAYPTELGRLAKLGRLTGSLWPNLVFFTPQVNAIAVFLEGGWFLSLALTWQSGGIKRLGGAMVMVIILYGLLISDSRGAWVSMAVTMGFWISSAGRFKLATVSGFLIVGVALIFLSSGFNAMLQTANSRLVLYHNSFYLLGDYPFTGIGLGETFALAYSRYQLLIPVPFLTYSHNLFLAIALGQGLLGLIAWLWLLVNFYRVVYQIETQKAPLLFRAAWLAVTTTLIHGLFDAPQFSESRWTMPMLFALLGLTIALGNRESETRPYRVLKPYKVSLPTAIALILLGGILFYRPLLGAWYANLGAVYQTQADLAPNLSESSREELTTIAVTYFEQSLRFNPTQRVANRRLGQIALQQQNFITAINYFEVAYPQEPDNQAILKALGLAYLWTGQLEAAESLLSQRNDQSEVVEELGNWQWWWGTQQRADLSGYAGEMVRRLGRRE